MAKQTKVVGRQYSLAACVDAGVPQIGAGNEVTFNVPAGAYVDGVDFQVLTAFDGSGTVTGTLSDGTTTFINAQTLKATGAVTVAVSKKYFPNGGKLTFSIADQNGNSANGSVLGFVSYKRRYAQNEAQD